MPKFMFITTIIAITFTLSCNSTSTQSEKAKSPDSTAAKNANMSQVYDLDTSKLSSGVSFYQCEMHPEIISDKPGNCPKCEMELSEMKKK